MYYKATKEMLTGIHLDQFFTTLKTEKAITSLDLSNIDFSSWTEDAFRLLFKNLPESVLKIDLSYCNLSQLSENSIDVLFGAAKITEYNLSGNNLGSLRGMKFYERFPKLVILNLSDNNLHAQPELLTERLAKIPHGIGLNLSNNQLDTVPLVTLAQALKGITYRTLVLNDNNLYTHNLKSLLSAISFSVSLLKLEWNCFKALAANELSDGIKAIPKHVKEVSLRHNNLALVTMRKVIETISADVEFKQELKVCWNDKENREMYFVFNSTDKNYDGKIYIEPARDNATPDAVKAEPANDVADFDESSSSYYNLKWLYALAGISVASLAAGIAAILLIIPAAIGISLSSVGGAGLLVAACGLFTYKPKQSDLPQHDVDLSLAGAK